MPYDADLRRAADVLNAGKKVAMLVGAGALHATDEVIAVADRLGAGAAKALLGKAALPDDLPWVTGSIGLLGTKPSYDLMTDCDTLLMIGSGFPYAEFLPKEGQARGVQIDIAPDMLGLRYPMEVNLRRRRGGDAARAAAAARRRRRTRAWRDDIAGDGSRTGGRRWRSARMAAGQSRSIRSAWSGSCRRACRTDAIVTSDSGSCANWYARDLKMRRGMMCFAVGRPRLDGRGGALRHRRQVRASRPAGDRAGRRRRDADEQHGRADHGRQILARMGRPALGLLRVQQRGPQSGHLGAAGDGGRSRSSRRRSASPTCRITASPS